MKKVVIISLCAAVAALLAVLLFAVILPNMQYSEVRTMQINNVDLSALDDGIYNGEFAYSSTVYKVQVEIKDHHIDKIDIIEGGSSEYAKSAEAVVQNIIDEQSIDVDVVSGATTSSKAILKAVENALTGN